MVNTQFGVRSQTICSIVPIAAVTQITVRYGRRIAGLSANSTGVLVPAMMRKMFDHEVFHLGTVIGYACHVVAIYLIVCAL